MGGRCMYVYMDGWMDGWMCVSVCVSMYVCICACMRECEACRLVGVVCNVPDLK